MENRRREVLDKGYVELVDFMGSDLRVCEAARVSTGSEADKGDVKNRGLIRYLYKNGHTSPFEKVVFEFHVKCPIFVARQWVRHRTQSWNEASARYKEFTWECHMPKEWRRQDTKNKQGSLEEIDSIESIESIESLNFDTLSSFKKSQEAYEDALAFGIAREQARIVMPVSQYTEFFTTVNLHNLFHFLGLRLHPHAQKEIRDYAQAILFILKEMPELKYSVSVFEEVLKARYLFQESLAKYDSLDKLEESLKEFIEKG